ncbi:MAG: hypothetical protein LBI87_00990 [Candidatus Accumulibacter sp.]|jgi:hypothetical protein|nr:hypothetical protein [Accumulibacter sp.]
MPLIAGIQGGVRKIKNFPDSGGQSDDSVPGGFRLAVSGNVHIALCSDYFCAIKSFCQREEEA